MNDGKQTRRGRSSVPVLGGSGLTPAHYSGSAVRSEVPYSLGAKLVGFLIAAGLVLLMLWFIWNFIGAN